MNVGPIEELERQIEDTRRALDNTLHSLQFKLSPRRRLQRAWHVTKDRTGRSLVAGTRWTRAHRLPVLLIAVAVVGALYLSASRLRRYR